MLVNGTSQTGNRGPTRVMGSPSLFVSPVVKVKGTQSLGSLIKSTTSVPRCCNQILHISVNIQRIKSFHSHRLRSPPPKKKLKWAAAFFACRVNAVISLHNYTLLLWTNTFVRRTSGRTYKVVQKWHTFCTP